ncbi:MAG TPA: hypothetical protein VGC46_08290 [Allosphingosinicella sp.]
MSLAGISAILGTLAAAPAIDVPQTAILILLPSVRGLGDTREGLAGDAERLLEGLQGEGRLRYRRSAILPSSLGACLPDEVEPNEARLSCLRRALPPTEGGLPLVAIVLSYTMERGAWQRMECIGPASHGFERTVYAQDADHPRADVRAAPRAAALRCITAALGDRAGPSVQEANAAAGENMGAAQRLAELNWQTCLEGQARALALRAVDRRAPAPQAETVMLACDVQESDLRRTLRGVSPPRETDAEFQRMRHSAAQSVTQLIQATYREHNYE